MFGFLKNYFTKKPKKQREFDCNHPCPGCLTRPSYNGLLCFTCHEKLNLWCPCGVLAPYEESLLIRKPIPDYLVSELCNRCGYRIKVIFEAKKQNNDIEVFRLVESMLK